jgi:hypothetical protein
MSSGLIISKHVHIGKDGIRLNGEVIYPELKGFTAWELLKELYNTLNLQYPKFFKMDALCQLAFISAELLLNDKDILNKYLKEQIAILLSNSASSLDTDRRYYDTIKDPDKYFPSPTVFVYTLPSIMNGEIAIRHGITGENNFLVSEKFDAALMVASVKDLFVFTDTQACITGWVEVDGDNFQALMYLVEGSEAGMAFNALNL